MKHVGVVMGSAPMIGVDLKQQLLFWDQIGIADLERLLEPDVRYRRALPNTPEDIEWLCAQDCVFGIPVELRTSALANSSYREALDEAGSISEEVKALAAKQDLGSHIRAFERGLESRALVCRALAVDIGLRTGVDAVSLLPINGTLGAERKQNVARIVIDSLPLPDGSVALQDILDFRAEHLQQLRALRLWASEAAQGSLTVKEIEEKLEFLTAEYAEELRLHRMLKRRGRIEVVVTAVAEVLENLVRLKFSSAARAILSIRRESAQLLLEERHLSGREISYVVHATESLHPER